MDLLNQITEFQASAQLIERLRTYGIRKTYDDGDVILNENAHIRSIPIVVKGTLRVIRTEEDGREILLYYIKAGESCIMSFLGGMHNETSPTEIFSDLRDVKVCPGDVDSPGLSDRNAIKSAT